MQTQLFCMRYTDQNMSTCVDKYTSLFAQLEQMGKDAAIPDSHKAPLLLASIDIKCSLESTATALRTKDPSDLTWEYVATTLIYEYNARRDSTARFSSSNKGRSKKKKKGKAGTNSVFRHNNTESSDSEDVSSEVDTTWRALAAALKSVKSHKVNNTNLHCDFCKREGHTEDKCWQNPEIPDNKLPPKLQEILASQAINDKGICSGEKKGSKKGKVEIAGAILEKTTISPPADHQSYADSGATAHCFHSKSAFVPGSLKPCPSVTALLANKSSV